MIENMRILWRLSQLQRAASTCNPNRKALTRGVNLQTDPNQSLTRTSPPAVTLTLLLSILASIVKRFGSKIVALQPIQLLNQISPLLAHRGQCLPRQACVTGALPTITSS